MNATRTPILVYVLATILIAGMGLTTAASGGVPPGSSIDPSAFLPADRATTWNPGMMGVGGIPVRATVCATLTPRGGALDDTAQIQAAINSCPPGQVVQLAAGTFIINSGNYVLINKGITLRGAGPGQTTLAKTNGAQPYPQNAVSARPSLLIVVGPAVYGSNGDNAGVVRSSQAAQLSRYERPHVTNAGVEDLKLIGGDAGNLYFKWAALSWPGT